MLKGEKLAEQYIDWTTGEQVHIIFRSPTLLNTLKNNGSGIIDVKQNYPSNANNERKLGLEAEVKNLQAE